jgi:hypothetical protein
MIRRIKTLVEAKKLLPAIWVVYDHPKDYPESIVVRAHFGSFPDLFCCICSTVDEARNVCRENGAGVMLMPEVNDDPVIMEMWL